MLLLFKNTQLTELAKARLDFLNQHSAATLNLHIQTLETHFNKSIAQFSGLPEQTSAACVTLGDILAASVSSLYSSLPAAAIEEYEAELEDDDEDEELDLDDDEEGLDLDDNEDEVLDDDDDEEGLDLDDGDEELDFEDDEDGDDDNYFLGFESPVVITNIDSELLSVEMEEIRRALAVVKSVNPLCDGTIGHALITASIAREFEQELATYKEEYGSITDIDELTDFSSLNALSELELVSKHFGNYEFQIFSSNAPEYAQQLHVMYYVYGMGEAACEHVKRKYPDCMFF